MQWTFFFFFYNCAQCSVTELPTMQRGRSTLELRVWEIGTHTFHPFKEEHIMLKWEQSRNAWLKVGAPIWRPVQQQQKKGCNIDTYKVETNQWSIGTELLPSFAVKCTNTLISHTQGVTTVTWLWGSRWATDLFLRTSTWGRQMVWMKWLNSWQAFGMGTPPRGRHSKVLVFHRMLLCCI